MQIAIDIVSGEAPLDDTVSEFRSRQRLHQTRRREVRYRARGLLSGYQPCITCLYRFSVAIRNPASRDLFRKCSEIDISHFESFDLGHVTDKFLVSNTYKYLIERLAKANSRRRQLLKYYEMHHDKIIGEDRFTE